MRFNIENELPQIANRPSRMTGPATMTAGLRKILLAAAWICVPVLIVLSLAPITTEHRTGVGGRYEHLIAYAGTTFLFMLSGRYRPAFVIVALALLAAALELGQAVTPTRIASAHDYAWSLTGVLVGAGTRPMAKAMAYMRRKLGLASG